MVRGHVARDETSAAPRLVVRTHVHTLDPTEHMTQDNRTPQARTLPRPGRRQRAGRGLRRAPRLLGGHGRHPHRRRRRQRGRHRRRRDVHLVAAAHPGGRTPHRRAGPPDRADHQRQLPRTVAQGPLRPERDPDRRRPSGDGRGRPRPRPRRTPEVDRPRELPWARCPGQRRGDARRARRHHRLRGRHRPPWPRSPGRTTRRAPPWATPSAATAAPPRRTTSRPRTRRPTQPTSSQTPEPDDGAVRRPPSRPRDRRSGPDPSRREPRADERPPSADPERTPPAARRRRTGTLSGSPPGLGHEELSGPAGMDPRAARGSSIR